jgi:hypothetical protein
MNLGINYFLNESPGIALDNFKAYFDFISGNNPLLINNKSGDLNISGEIKNISLPINLNNFYKNTGEAFFNSGSYIKIHNITGVDLTNFTISFIYENLRNGGATIISNIKTGLLNTFNEFGVPQENTIYKGFELGVTSNNKLYFEYYSQNGPDIFISDFSLSNRNSVFLSFIENNIVIGYYDFYKNTLFSNNFIIDSEFIFDPQSLYIGYNPDASGLFNFNQLFTGFISEFLLFSPAIYNYDVVSINSGYAHTYIPGSLATVTTIISGITGYVDQLTGYTSGVTGIESSGTGIIQDEWGVSYTGFQDIELSGLIPLSGTVAISGQIDSFTEEILTGESLSLDYTFLNSLGKNNINFLSKIDSEDILELNSYTDYSNLNNIQKNIRLSKDFIENKFYISNEINFSGTPVVFINGQAHLSGNLLLTGSPYSSGIFLLNDYYYNEDLREFIFNNIYNENDSAFIDIENVNETLFIKDFSTNTGANITLTGWNDNLNKFYFNGQKLINGIDYKTLLPQLQDSLTGTTGYYDAFGRNFSINTNGEILVVGAPSKRNNSSQTVGSIEIFKRVNSKYNLIQGITGTISGESFGNNLSTSSDGRIIAVSNSSPNNGRVWIYQSNNLSNWSLYQTLSGNAGSSFFGERLALSLDGTVLTVGSPPDVVAPNSTGSIWVYTGGFNRTWTQTQKITGLMNSVGFANIGWPANPVLNSGGTVLGIGFDSKNVGGDLSAGAVSIYTGVGGVYNFSQELIGDPVGQSSGDLFGRSLAITDVGNILTVGSLHDQIFENGTLDGALFIFETGSDRKFFLKQKLKGDLDPLLRQNDRFGYFTDMSADGSIIITSSQHDEGSALPTTNQSVGAFWVYRKNTFGTWDQIHKEVGTGINNFFGLVCKLSRDGSTIVIGEQPFLFGLGSRGSTKIYSQDVFSVNDVIFENINPLYSGTTGVLIGIPKSYNNTIIELGQNLFSFNTKYLYNLTEIYKNGIRQTIGTDYLELPVLDSNNGTGFFDLKPDLIYNNEGFIFS